MSGEGSGSPATPSLGASCVHNLLQIVLFRQEHFKQNGRDFFFYFDSVNTLFVLTIGPSDLGKLPI